MAIDMKNLKTNSSINTELKESSDVKPAEAPTSNAELTGNTSDNAENVSETTEQTATKSGKKALVEYIGHGVWRDSNGDVWSKTANEHASILTSRSYPVEEYEKRQDFKFMEGYGEIKVTIV